MLRKLQCAPVSSSGRCLCIPVVSYLSIHCEADFEIVFVIASDRSNFQFAHFGLSQFEPVLHALSAVGAFCLLQTSAILFLSCTVLEQLALKNIQYNSCVNCPLLDENGVIWPALGIRFSSER
ncbi:hypothetical protein T10_12649 [Trichinella papuae]|uniref:Uncharacterized protein n=1 Tax=Trichinella papuae TaxID=268474 RepID=A0A0V1MLG4_9BILA|nr:hypothetical protein T10_12649 [Trichinella papuae]